MSWMQQLCKVYDNNLAHVGEFEERRNQRMTLLPVSHVMQEAQIEILITPEGDFVSAKVIDKENARTIMPASIDSASRGNGSNPLALHDKLCYVAGDYIKFGGDTKREKYYNDYINQLKRWANSNSATDKVKSIYAYVSKGNVIEDLVNAKILPTDASGKVIEKWVTSKTEDKPEIYKVVSGGAMSAIVRFDIIHQTFNDSVVWEDKALFDSYIKYYECELRNNGGSVASFCYITGIEDVLTTKHGNGIRYFGDNTKLISGNDNRGFTYRGRFKDSAEAVSIGYEVSQKTHHALRWLIQRQGTYIAKRYFVAFGVEQNEVPEPFDGTASLIGEDIFAQAIKELSKSKTITEELVAEEVNKALQGKKHTLSNANLENIIILAVDSATNKGRLAIVYYQHLKAKLFFDAIQHWHRTCNWLQVHKSSDKKLISFVGTPSTYRIVEAVYGSKADPRIKKDLYTRLLPCIVEKRRIPNDIIQIIFNRVRNPSSFKDLPESWTATLNIACALINKLYETEGYKVALDEGNESRDYLFGRLLGIAEVMESRILTEREKESGKGEGGKKRVKTRATNATRYFNAFSQHPARTWIIIRKQLNPYFESSSFDTGYYAYLLQNIEDRLTIEQMTNEPLSPIFLLGYSSQVQSMYTKKKEEIENDNLKPKD